jgi:hypothetical protein
MPNQTTNIPMVMKVLRIIEVTMEQRVRLRVPSAMRTEYERSRLNVIVLVLDGDERVGWFENRFPEMMGDERSSSTQG